MQFFKDPFPLADPIELKSLHSLYSDEVNNTLHKNICDMIDVVHNGIVDHTQQQDGE